MEHKIRVVTFPYESMGSLTGFRHSLNCMEHMYTHMDRHFLDTQGPTFILVSKRKNCLIRI